MAKRLIELKVNGDSYEVAIDPRRTLLEVLRESLNLTGTKEACDTGDCGACTVLLNGIPVLSCLVLAMDAVDKEIVTIEGLSEGITLHPVQQAFVEYGAIQCGYCSPGMILTAKAYLEQNPHPTRDEVKMAISGNLCRCTGYVKIVDAIMAAAQQS